MKFFNIKAVGCKVDIQKLNHFPICQLNTYVWFEAKNKITTLWPKIKYPYTNLKEKGVRFTRGENHTLRNEQKGSLEQGRDGLCSWMRHLITNCNNTGTAWKKQMLNDDTLYDANNLTAEKRWNNKRNSSHWQPRSWRERRVRRQRMSMAGQWLCLTL